MQYNLYEIHFSSNSSFVSAVKIGRYHLGHTIEFLHFLRLLLSNIIIVGLSVGARSDHLNLSKNIE
jgi:hypothetical protein